MIREEILKNIQKHAVPPPPVVWGKIAAQLDELDLNASSDAKIVAITNQPADRADTVIPKGSKSSQRFINRFNFKVQVAAALLLLAGTAIIWYQVYQKRETSSMVAAAATDSSIVGGTTMYPPSAAPIAASNERSVRNQNPALTVRSSSEKSRLRPAKVSLAVLQKTNFLRTPTTHSLEKLLADEALEADNIRINENYFYMTSKDGLQLRVSKKIAPAILEDWGIEANTSTNTHLELLVLTNKIAAWKSKLEGSTFIPAASNLMDLLYFIDSQED